MLYKYTDIIMVIKQSYVCMYVDCIREKTMKKEIKK